MTEHCQHFRGVQPTQLTGAAAPEHRCLLLAPVQHPTGWRKCAFATPLDWRKCAVPVQQLYRIALSVSGLTSHGQATSWLKRNGSMHVQKYAVLLAVLKADVRAEHLRAPARLKLFSRASRHCHRRCFNLCSCNKKILLFKIPRLDHVEQDAKNTAGVEWQSWSEILCTVF